jgi:dipeptidyl aminopeptidase/acylaminoacyl peptidase
MIRRRLLPILFLCLAAPLFVRGQEPTEKTAEALDQKLLAEAKTNPEVLANLTYLSDEIGPRLTGAASLKRANEWAAARMKAYALTNVHQEAWTMPEGWERGTATARFLEPDNGVRLVVASAGWSPGTKGKVQGDVVILKASTPKELDAYKGKLKGAFVLTRPPSKLVPLDQIDKPRTGRGNPAAPDEASRRTYEEMRAMYRQLREFLQNEEVGCILNDSSKPLGLLDMTGGWQSKDKDRPSAGTRAPQLFVAHNHYQLLYRLASRPEPAHTRLEIDIQNTFVPGPVAVNNTIGEIKGTDKADEVVVVGAHLDSWDLGQGTTDNGSGTTVLLETARVLGKCGVRPRRTIRFILFTGEEQGLHGSRSYVEQHKDEMAKVSAALVHDTGTGKVIGISLRQRPVLQGLLGKELATLKELGLEDFSAGSLGGSDHASFEAAGVPGMMFWQESAGYSLSHHSQADTLDRAIEANLIQGTQVMAVAAVRIANLENLLSREKVEGRPGRPQGDAGKEEKKSGRLVPDDLGKLVGLADPQISPDGKSIALVVSRPNYDKNKYESEIVLVDIVTGKHRVLTHDRVGASQPRWSPTGDRLAFLAVHGAGKEAKQQIHVLPMEGGDARRVTDAPNSIQHYAWKPDGKEIAYAAADEAPNKKDIEKGNDAFEIGNDDFLTTAAPTSTHVWLVSADGGTAKQLTSGKWSLATVPPPGPPSSPLSWSPDGKSILIVRQETPHDGDNDKISIQVLDVASGKLRPLTGRSLFEMVPSFSPDGAQVAYWYPRDDDPNNEVETWVAPASGGKGTCLTRKLDRCILHSVWLPDGKGLLVGGHDGTHVALWNQPLSGEARKIDLGKVCPTWAYRMDAQVGPGGIVAFTGSEAGHPTELYCLDSMSMRPRRLTDFNAEVAKRELGKMETITWKVAGFEADGVVTYPPDFSKDKKYPLVLLIHGGPSSASVERFNTWSQLIAATGTIVFEPNYRGSDHLGNAYMRAIVGDWGKGPGEDVMAGVEALRQQGFVDEKRIAVTGWSYGGYMTSWLIGHYHVWKTAIAGASVTDWLDMYDLSDGNVQTRYNFGGSPWSGDFTRQYREHSPLSYARDIRTPTLIMATTGDPRCPITQSYHLFHALKDNDVPVKFVAFPVHGHFPGDPVRQKDLFRRWNSWLEKQLK